LQPDAKSILLIYNVKFTFLGIYLQGTVKYSFFLKVWYDENTYAVFKSDGVTIAIQKPGVTNIRGSAVSCAIRRYSGLGTSKIADIKLLHITLI
jgi:hypothetical protein